MSRQRPLAARYIGSASNYTTGTTPNNGQKRRQRQILSLGKDMPVAPQGGIVTTVLFPKGEMEARRRVVGELTMESELNLLAPFGSEQCYVIKQGELVFQIINGNDMAYNIPSSHQSNSVSDIYGKGCVNGLRRGIQMRCVGWSATDNDTTNEDTDNCGTVQTTGTCTVINTGPNAIPAMATVVFDEEPYVLMDAKGHKIPGVLTVGDPGSEHRSNMNCKFLPALYYLSETNIPTLIAGSIMTLEDNLGPQPFDFKNSGNNLDTVINAIDVICRERACPSMKLKEFLIVHACHCLLYYDFTSLKTIKETIMKHVVSRLRNLRKVVNEAMGEKEDSLGSFFAAFDSDSASEYDLSTALLKLRDYLVCDLHSWIRAHAIGTSYSHAESGAALQLNLKFFFC